MLRALIIDASDAEAENNADELVTIQEHGQMIRKIDLAEAIDLARKRLATGQTVTITIDPTESEARQIAAEEATA